jgi:hypothetical protein
MEPFYVAALVVRKGDVDNTHLQKTLKEVQPPHPAASQ